VIAASWLLIFFPALGAVVLLVGGRRTNAWGHLLGCATVIVSFVYAVVTFISSDVAGGTDTLLYSWLPVADLQVEFGLRVDPLSAVFTLLITGVGALIHVYSIGYMADDDGRRRFFGYLNLFVAAMLLLVLGNGFVTLYLGWEGVGLASYLLIGWYTARRSAATAAKKAFLMNRVGDVGLLLAIFLMFKYLGSTGYSEVFAGIDTIPTGAATAIGLLLLLGAVSKSGQFPLQAWLPDAMEGPTPVSALIHAATMVTAGVYLIARANPIFDVSAAARLTVTAVGAFTLLLGCIIGCAYDDIKKVLAYSTVSQIGYMMLAVGLGPFGYALGILHLLTHGFFKAGLFLGAGSIMHGMNDEVDMRKFGGLYRHMPITFVTFGLGFLAIIGFPFLSGYYSKDAIIEATFGAGGAQGWVFGLAALLGAGITGFYMTRLMIMTFFGRERWKGQHSADGRAFRPRESPAVMTVPMIVLAIGSVAGGFVLTRGDMLVEYLAPSLGGLAHSGQSTVPEALVPYLTLAVSALGVLAAWLLFGRREPAVQRPLQVSPLVRAARNDLYGNALNEALVARPGTWLTRFSVYLDNRGVDGAVNGLAALLGGSSGRLSRLQTGFVRSYALSMFVGAFLLVGTLLVVRFS